jgi:hypothetical protein
MVRLLLYPAAIALIAFGWHERRARADARARTAVLELRGTTSQRLAMTAVVAGGVLDGYSTKVRLACPANHPELTGLWVYHRQALADGHFVVRGQAIRGESARITYTWEDGMQGRGDTRVDARLDGSSLRGTLSLDIDLAFVGGAVPCHSGPVGFVLRRR